MAATQFKLTKHGGLTRRMTFPEPPRWISLSTKIESLYGIPVDKVAVSYVDHDGDEVTMSTEEELIDFYENCHKHGEPVKFTIIDLGSLRARNAVPQDEGEKKPEDTGIGNTGPTVLFEVNDGDWQRLPGFPDIFTMPSFAGASQTEDAFVEVVESDALSSEQGKESSTGNGKGKEKIRDYLSGDISSTGSVLDDEIPAKPPVHVYDVSDRGDRSPSVLLASPKTPRSERNVPGLSSPHSAPAVHGASAFDWIANPQSVPPPFIYVDRSSTSSSPVMVAPDHSKPLPKTPSTRPTSFVPSPPPVIVSPADSTQSTPKHALNTFNDPTSDPLLTPFNGGSSQRNSPLTNDVANLLNALSTAFASHPELSEGLRNIVRNAASGAYWASASDEMANAAETIQLAAQESTDRIQRVAEDVRRNAEQDAGWRVAEAVTGIFKVISGITNGVSTIATTSQTQPSTAAPATPTVSEQQTPVAPPPIIPTIQADQAPTSSYGTNWSNFAPPLPPPPMFMPPPPGFGIPAPPPPHHHGGGHIHTPPQGPHGPFHGRHFPHPPPPPPLGGAQARAPFSPHQPPWMEQMFNGTEFTGLRRNNTWTTGHVPGTFHSTVTGHVAPSFDSTSAFHAGLDGHDIRLDPHERKIQLEAAKAYYKAEKERFKKEKEERKRARREVEEKKAEEGIAHRSSPTREETIVARIPLTYHDNTASPGTSTSKGAHPRPGTLPPHRAPSFAEIYSVPRPHQPRYRGSLGSRPYNIPRDAVKPPTVDETILARLADMGFSRSSHPNIPTLLRAFTHPNGEAKKESEDVIVTKMLEALISAEASSHSAMLAPGL